MIIVRILPFLFLMFSGTTDTGAIYRPWQVFEIKLTSEMKHENPYSLISPDNIGQDLVTAVFTGVSGEAKGKEIEIAGFWVGGDTWKIRFAPPLSGRWKYFTQSEDQGLNMQEGFIDVEPWMEKEKKNNPIRRGFLQVNQEEPRPGRYFIYEDGTPFFGVGDTWWNWTKRSIDFSSFQKLVNDRAEKGFTIGQLFVAGNGWSREASLLDETYTILDIEHMKRIDKMIEYANSKGITVWIHGWWTRKNIVETIGADKIRRWWKYLIHRLGAYNVIWTIAGEYNMYNYGGFNLSFWKGLGQMIEKEDPYERIISAHPTPPGWKGGADAPQWSTGEVLHKEVWLDYNQSQTGHGRWRQEMIPHIIKKDYQRKPTKPTVITEPWYEFVEGNASGYEVRFGAWTAVLSGAAGHSYGGGHVWSAHLPESPAGGGSWPIEESFEVNTYDYEGALSMGYMADFFSNIDWWAMNPTPELVHDYREPYCLAKPGEEYVIYLRWGGPASIDLRTSGAADEFVYRWFNPATGEYVSEGVAKGGRILSISSPENYPRRQNFQDWVLYVKKKKRDFSALTSDN